MEIIFALDKNSKCMHTMTNQQYNGDVLNNKKVLFSQFRDDFDVTKELTLCIP